jgi:hypothetical protein
VVIETSLELIPCDGVDICMGVTVCLPPICYRTKEHVHGKKNLLSMESLACEKVVGQVHRYSTKRDWCGGGGGGACCW